MATALQERLNAKRNEVQATTNRNREEYLDRYVALVKATAAAGEVDPAEALEVLNSLDLDADQLIKDAAMVEHRNGLRQQGDQRGTAQQQLESTQRELSDKRAELDAAIRKLRGPIQQLQGDIVSHDFTIQQAQRAELELKRQYPWWLKEWSDSIDERRRELGTRNLEQRLKEENQNVQRFQALADNKNSYKNPIHVNDDQKAFYANAAKNHADIKAALERTAPRLRRPVKSWTKRPPNWTRRSWRRNHGQAKMGPRVDLPATPNRGRPVEQPGLRGRLVPACHPAYHRQAAG